MGIYIIKYVKFLFCLIPFWSTLYSSASSTTNLKVVKYSPTQRKRLLEHGTSNHGNGWDVFGAGCWALGFGVRYDPQFPNVSYSAMELQIRDHVHCQSSPGRKFNLHKSSSFSCYTEGKTLDQENRWKHVALNRFLNIKCNYCIFLRRGQMPLFIM